MWCTHHAEGVRIERGDERGGDEQTKAGRRTGGQLVVRSGTTREVLTTGVADGLAVTVSAPERRARRPAVRAELDRGRRRGRRGLLRVLRRALLVVEYILLEELVGRRGRLWGLLLLLFEHLGVVEVDRGRLEDDGGHGVRDCDARRGRVLQVARQAR